MNKKASPQKSSNKKTPVPKKSKSLKKYKAGPGKDDLNALRLSSVSDIWDDSMVDCKQIKLLQYLRVIGNNELKEVDDNFERVSKYLSVPACEIILQKINDDNAPLHKKVLDHMKRFYPDIMAARDFVSTLDNSSTEYDVLWEFGGGQQMQKNQNDTEFNQNVKTMNGLFNQAPKIKHPVFVFRGISIHKDSDWNRGILESNQSTSLTITESVKWSSKNRHNGNDARLLFMIKLSPGTPILYTGNFGAYPDEFEVILPAGGSYKEITKVTEIKKMRQEANRLHFDELNSTCSKYNYLPENIVFVEFVC